MYTVWIDYGHDGWKPSDNLPDLDAVLTFITHETYGSPWRLTRDIDVQLIETPRVGNGFPGDPLCT